MVFREDTTNRTAVSCGWTSLKYYKANVKLIAGPRRTTSSNEADTAAETNHDIRQGRLNRIWMTT